MLRHLSSTILFIQKWKYLSIIVMFILLLTLPLVVIVMQNPTVLRQHAATANTVFSNLTPLEARIADVNTDNQIGESDALLLFEALPDYYQKLASISAIEKPLDVIQAYNSLLPSPPTLSQPPLTTINPGTLSTCGAILKSGAYTLNQNLSNSSGCIHIQASNVSVDCAGHTITVAAMTPFESPLEIIGGNNVTIQNCRLATIPYSSTTPLRLVNVTNATITNIATNGERILVDGSSGVQMTGNYFNSVLLIRGGQNNTVFHNSLYPLATNANAIYRSWVMAILQSPSTSVMNNTVDGSWDGRSDESGWENGIVLASSDNVNTPMHYRISGNVIQNIRNSGIQTVGSIADTTISSNIIARSGLSGIGGWYDFSWSGNSLQSNMISASPAIFFFFQTDKDAQTVFDSNSISGNSLLNQTSSLPGFINSSYINLGGNYQNNILQTNNFGHSSESPFLQPSSIVTDKGNNICNQTNSPVTPLHCLTK